MSFKEFDDNDFDGVQESPIPSSTPKQKRRTVKPKERKSSFPDPNHVVKKPNVRKLDYDAMSTPQETAKHQQQVGKKGAKPKGVVVEGEVVNQQVAQKIMQTDMPLHRGANQSQSGNTPPIQTPPNQKPKKSPKRKKFLGFAGIGLVVLLLIIIVVKLLWGSNTQEAQIQNYDVSGKHALDELQSTLNNYDATSIDKLVGTDDGDSYLSQEWAYVNNVKIREEFIKRVCSLVKFKYPQVQQLSTEGEPMNNSDGSPIMIESYMNNGEAMKVTIPDYDKIAQTMDEKSDYIKKLYESSHFSEADYTWEEELINLMLQFVLDDESIPTTTVEVTLPIRLNTKGQPYIESDAPLDDILFGSEAFHNMNAKFSQIVTGWTGFKTEKYTATKLKHNKEFDKWFKIFIEYYKADGGSYNAETHKFSGGRFNKHTSKWEPWYLRDKNNPNKIVKDENGEKVVNYFSIKDKNGNDWIQPAEEIEVKVKKTRQVPDTWEEEKGIYYSWIGTHYLESYSGRGSTIVRVGDGSREHPAGIGTSIVTKVLGTDGVYHDVKVAMTGYWTEQDAIDYAEKFDTRNRGFTTSSVVQLICYEIQVENLENKPFSFMSSEMCLSDRNNNISSRTGTMYGFSGKVRLEARGDEQKRDKVYINDWATSTELAQKYPVWGKSFGRTYPMVYFNCLAGTGNIPSYSAYEQFTGKSKIDDSASTDITTQTVPQADDSEGTDSEGTDSEGTSSDVKSE